MTLRVLLLCTAPSDISPPWNEGTKNNQFAWIDILQKYDVEFHIISTSYFKKEKVVVHSIEDNRGGPISKIIFTIKTCILARKLCRENKVDIVSFVFGSYVILIPLIILHTIKQRRILILSNERYLKHLEEFKVRLGRPPQWLKSFIFGYFDRVIAVSQKLKCELIQEEIIDQDKVFFYPAVPMSLSSWQPPTNDESKSLREKYMIRDTDFLIFHLGNFHPTRGVEDLVMALSRIDDESVKLFLAHNGIGKKDQLIDLIDELGLSHRVKLANTVNAKEIYSICDIFVFPLRTQLNVLEYPLSLIEAMLMEKAVISTNLESFRELVTHNETGVLVEPNNPVQLANQIKRLKDNLPLRQKVAKQGRISILELYSTNPPENLLNVYKF